MTGQSLKKNSMLVRKRCECGAEVFVASDGVQFDVQQRALLVRPKDGEDYRPMFGEPIGSGGTGVRIWQREIVHLDHQCPVYGPALAACPAVPSGCPIVNVPEEST